MDFVSLDWVCRLTVVASALFLSGPGLSVGATLPPSSTTTSVEADRLGGHQGESITAQGSAVIRQGPLTVKAEHIEYLKAQDLVTATERVEIDNPEAHLLGSHLSLVLKSQTGSLKTPRYTLKANGAQGQADRFDFLGPGRSQASRITYSTCRREDYPEDHALPWELRAQHINLDFDRNEGLAQSAVLRFYDLPILALPVMSFPVTGARKSGWLTPTLSLSNRSGPSLEVPWYWNIAPNHDATLTPTLATKHGSGAKAEYRYLMPWAAGEWRVHGLPQDKLVDRDRWSSLWKHADTDDLDHDIDIRWQRVSDDAYWKDFGPQLDTLTPRLLSSNGRARYHWRHSDDHTTTAYLRAQHWQVLQDPTAPIVAPYRRDPQVGIRNQGYAGAQYEWQWQLEAEDNRFTHINPAVLGGQRSHATATLGRTWGGDGVSLTPSASLNTTHYATDRPMRDGRTQATRTVPTFSLDQRLQFERDTTWFSHDYIQTLEPRVHYVYTPFRAQNTLPIFDTAPQDFNFASLFAPNTFSGMDRIADANRATTGVISRWIDAAHGGETASLGLVQRQLLRAQQVTPGDGAPLTQLRSDILLLGSTTVIPAWSFDASVQYSPEIDRTTRSTLGTRYFPGAYRTVGATYRYTRSQLEQVDLSWQWPLAGAATGPRTPAREDQPPWSSALHQNPVLGTTTTSPHHCGGAWYGLGRVNYSLRESRITDSAFGLEYNAQCWIGRFFISRQSTSPTQAITAYGMQIELVGLSRLATSPDPTDFFTKHIAGYQAVTSNRTRNAP